MSLFWICLVGLLTGIFASMGLGGGMILIVYLTVFAGIDQLAAQGINLIFFIPIAIISIIIHSKNKMIEWKKIVPTIICGTIGAFVGSLIATNLESKTLSKLFAIILIIVGLKEFFSKENQS